jgi:nucleoside-diphosphate-sugar epimerase
MVIIATKWRFFIRRFAEIRIYIVSILSMKICITGGAGMIGSTLIRKLTALGHNISVIDNLWRGDLDNLKGVVGFSDENFYNIDLSKTESLKEVGEIFSDCDCVIHLADIVAGIGFVFSNQYEIFRINNLINTNVFNACATAGVKKILYAGTACSFPKTMQMSLDSVLREEDLFPSYPESAYGWSKLMGTLELEYLKDKTGCEVTTLMLHNVYGPFCDIDPTRSQVIPSVIRKILELPENGQLVVWGSGNQGRAFLHVSDVADAFVAALQRDNLPLVIQIGPDYCTSIKELAYTLNENVIDKQISIVFDTTKPEGDIGRCADYSLAKEVLEWSPKVNFIDGLKETTAYIEAKLGQIA